MGTGGWGASRDHLCTGQRGFSINLQVWSPHAARVSGVGRLVSCKTLANPRFQPLPRSCWSLGGRGRPWVAQSGYEPRPRCQQRVHAAHGSVRLTAALLNYPEDVTKGKLFSAPLAAPELGCPLLPSGKELVQLAWLHSTQLSGMRRLSGGCCATESVCNCEKQ